MTTPGEIKEMIEKAVPKATAYVSDPNNDGEHFEAIVVSPVFEGMLLVKQHQMVLNALRDKFAGAVHALRLKTFTPMKWNEIKNQFSV